jgi:hypothetical protein
MYKFTIMISQLISYLSSGDYLLLTRLFTTAIVNCPFSFPHLQHGPRLALRIPPESTALNVRKPSVQWMEVGETCKNYKNVFLASTIGFHKFHGDCSHDVTPNKPHLVDTCDISFQQNWALHRTCSVCPRRFGSPSLYRTWLLGL